MHSFVLHDTEPGELKPYVDGAFWRFLHTWGCVRDLHGRALELGANPYFTTFLLQRFTALDLSLANFFAGRTTNVAEEWLRWTDRDGDEHAQPQTSDLFNVEQETFPYPDSTYDIVLFCEIIEHLLMDPMCALREIHRVLRPGGRVVVTTPNVARLENVLRLVGGVNIYDPYTAATPYGRHNREYTMDELVQLLSFAGFDVERQFTADAHSRIEPLDARPEYAAIAPALKFRDAYLGEYLFVVARSTRTPRPGRPPFLYRGYPASAVLDDKSAPPD
jgi:SAM-dependent methyltransferase